MPFGPSLTYKPKVRTSIERESLVLTLIAGIPSRGIACVCQKPTPAVSKIASSVVSCSTISSTFALAKSEGGIWLCGQDPSSKREIKKGGCAVLPRPLSYVPHIDPRGTSGVIPTSPRFLRVGVNGDLPLHNLVENRCQNANGTANGVARRRSCSR